MDAEEPISLCPVHAVPAASICDCCGRFGCGDCLLKNLTELWCVECHARPQARLVPSDRAKSVLLMALIGFHGFVVLLPVAFLLGRKELAAIESGESVPAGRPYAQGAVALASVGGVMWTAALLWWLSS